MHTNIKATREGLNHQKTSSGWKINNVVPFVALPSVAALRQKIKIYYKDKSVIALVLDVGPWNTEDDRYVFGSERPQAETGIDMFTRKTNMAGIDLGEAVRNALGILEDNVEIDWEFI